MGLLLTLNYLYKLYGSLIMVLIVKIWYNKNYSSNEELVKKITDGRLKTSQMTTQTLSSKILPWKR